MLCIAACALTVCVPAASAATDPLLAQQWALTQSSAIGAAEAWSQSSGSGVVVAVLDSGVQTDHPELRGNLWTNTGEVAANGLDDDRNGVIDDVHGANMFDASSNIADDHGHGTHVSGIIVARRDNGTGGAGLAPDAQVMTVKVLDAALAGNTTVLARGIRYAVDEGARILNVSVNSDLASQDLVSAVRYAGERGATIVASAGNNGRNLDLQPSFPASLPDPAVLGVTATTPSGGLWPLANLGRQSIDLAAPGEHILSTSRGSAYEFRKGTSAAAPYVAGALALMAAARPELPQAALRDALLATSRRSSALPALLSAGALDAGAAMHQLLPGADWRTAAPAAAPSPGLRLRVGRAPRAGGRARLRWQASDATGVANWRVSLDGRVVATLDPDRRALAQRVKRAGRHVWRVVAFDASGAKLLASRRHFKVRA